jgi:hypothetical protein
LHSSGGTFDGRFQAEPESSPFGREEFGEFRMLLQEWRGAESTGKLPTVEASLETLFQFVKKTLQVDDSVVDAELDSVRNGF